MIDALNPAVMVHRDGKRVKLTTDAALARFFDNRNPDHWFRAR